MQIGELREGYFDGGANIGRGSGSSPGDLTLRELLDQYLPHRVPSNVETAAFTCAADDTWEDYDIITALNLVLTTKIRTGEAVELRGTLELVNGEAAINNAKWGDGDTPDDDDTVTTYATQAAAASEYVHDLTIVTGEDGKIKIEVDDKANLSFVFHLQSFRYCKAAAIS